MTWSGVRLLAVLAVLVACTPGDDAVPLTPPSTDSTVSGPGGADSPASPSPSPSVSAGERSTAVFVSPPAAGESPAAVRAAVVGAMDVLGPTVDPAWLESARDGVAGDWPIVLGEATVTSDGAVDAALTMVVDVAADWDLRLLPAAAALGDVGLVVAGTSAGEAVEMAVDPVGARLGVPHTGTEDVVVVDLAYTVPDRSAIVDDGSPAGFGLLARSDAVVALGHWLPVPMLASDSGPMQARGDVGAFPAAAWSVVVHHDGVFVSSGEDSPCPEVVERRPGLDCTWSRGLGLRDLSAVLIVDAEASEEGGVRVVAPSGALSPDRRVQSVSETRSAMANLASLLGPLPWTTLDVVAVPMLPGAAGMEFPGMVWIDPGAWPADDGELGSYVLAHEVGHQWFHALVGNGSLSAPVVDEATAQYLSYLVFADRFGQDAAAALDARSITGRGERAVADGTPDEPPALALDLFTSARSYGAAVYGRGGAAWIEAERAAGRDATVAVLRALVERHGLGEATVADVLAVATEVDPVVADALADGWGTTPVVGTGSGG